MLGTAPCVGISKNKGVIADFKGSYSLNLKMIFLVLFHSIVKKVESEKCWAISMHVAPREAAPSVPCRVHG